MPIDKRLGRIFGLAIVFCLLVTSLGFSATLLYYSHSSFSQELSSVANVAGATSRAALAFDDSQAGDRVLSALSARKNIIYAALIDTSGKILSEFGIAPQKLMVPHSVKKEVRYWSWSYAQLAVPVSLDGELIGCLLVISSLSSFYDQLIILTIITVSLMLIASLGAFYFNSVLRKVISVPIISLRDFAKNISITKNFSTRLPTTDSQHSEVTQLIQTFNQMLEQLEERDRALILAKEKAEQADKLKSIFLASVSHEIRTPLHAILGMTDEILHTNIDNEQRELLEVVKSSGGLLISIISDILDFSKIEAGKLDLSTEKLELPEFLHTVMHMFELASRKKGLSLSASIAPEVPSTIIVDRGRLAQILVNLLGNALKFTSSGSIKIDVRIREKPKRKDKVELHFSISDTGIGIPEDALNSIFESFIQIIGPDAKNREGTGLGLAISSRLVSLMGGSIWAESKLGIGSTFHFIVEVSKSSDSKPVSTLVENRSKGSEQAQQIESAAFNANMFTILVVEDNKVNSKLAQRVLSKAGYNVVLAFNGEECLEVLSKQQIDLILMDVNMPILDGIATTKRIREAEMETGEHIKIIALTANAIEDTSSKCLETGMDEFLTKPLDRNSLLSAIERNLPEKPRAHRKNSRSSKIANDIVKMGS